MSGGTDLPPRRGPAAVRNIALTNKLAACEVVTAQHPVLLEREDCKLAAWYRSFYAPRTGGAHDSHHRTAGVAGCTRRYGNVVAARGARAADGDAGDRFSRRPVSSALRPLYCCGS